MTYEVFSKQKRRWMTLSEIVHTEYFAPLGMQVRFLSNGLFVASMHVVGDSPEFKTFDDAVEWLHTNTPTLEEFPEFLREDSFPRDTFFDFACYVTKALTQVNSPLKEICRENMKNVVPDPGEMPQAN
jgi:hypothetical protein